MKFWRSHSESQRVKAEILQAYYAVPQPSQRAVAQRLRVSQPYVAKLFSKIRREGPERAVGPEAYGLYKKIRDAERPARHEGLISQRRGAVTQVKQAEPQGPMQYVELARDENGEVIEIYGSRPASAVRPCKPRPPQASGIPTRNIYGEGREQTDAVLREFARIGGRNRENYWF